MKRVFFTVECRECGRVGSIEDASAAQGNSASIGRIMIERRLSDDAADHNARNHRVGGLAVLKAKVVRWNASTN